MRSKHRTKEWVDCTIEFIPKPLNGLPILEQPFYTDLVIRYVCISFIIERYKIIFTFLYIPVHLSYVMFALDKTNGLPHTLKKNKQLH